MPFAIQQLATQQAAKMTILAALLRVLIVCMVLVVLVLPTIGIAAPKYEYRFDEINWNGTAGEIIDTQAAGNASTVGAANNVANGYLCRAGNFAPNSFAANIDAVSTPFIPGAKGAVDFWYSSNVAWNTLLSDAILLDATTDSTKPFVLSKNALGQIVLRYRDTLALSPVTVTTSANNFAANTWHHIAVSWDLTSTILSSSAFTIYIDGAAQPLALSVTTSLLGIQTPDTLYIGDSRSSNTVSGLSINGTTFNNANGMIDEVKMYNTSISIAQVLADKAATHSCPNYIDHYQIEHDGNGLTCTPETITVKACANASCTSLYTGIAITGNVTWTGGATGAAAFTIPAGSSQTTVSVPVITPATITYATSGTSVTPSNTGTCLNTATSTSSCNMIFADSGFYFDVPHHIAETTQAFTVSAVKKSDNSLGCTPAFASVSKSINFTCAYTNPATGTLPIRIAGNALNVLNSTALACDSTGRAVTLAFNSSGVATTNLQYADVGNMTLSASYTSGGLTMTGSDTFIAAPSNFAFSSVTAAPIKAAANFSATVTARNLANAATPNYGKETPAQGVTLGFAKCQPTGTGAVAGSFTGNVGAFSNGAATTSNLAWSEVGNGELSATGPNYLSAGLAAATGNTATSGTLCSGTGGAGNVGRFIPDRFNTVVTQGCSSGGFSYSGQPFAVQIRALNVNGVLTQNYDGSLSTTPNFAKVVTLSDANASTAGALSPTSVALSSFNGGIANATPKYTFTSLQTAPTTIKLRAVDTDNTSSATGTEGTSTIKSGRITMTSVYGSELLDLSVPVEVQYWNGTSYVRNQQDSCTSIPLSAVTLGNYKNNLNACESTLAGNINLVNGVAKFLKLTKSGAGNDGSVDVSINLSAAAGSTCLSATGSAATNAGLPWLGSNPNARASFGIYKTPIIYLRENF